MRIQQAIESERPFRRKGWLAWYTLSERGTWIKMLPITDYDYAFGPTKEDILSSDWEIYTDDTIQS